MKKFMFLLFIAAMLTSCGVIKFWQVDHPDNFIEEVVEDVIEEKTGINIDLSPITGEENQSIDIFNNDFN